MNKRVLIIVGSIGGLCAFCCVLGGGGIAALLILTNRTRAGVDQVQRINDLKAVALAIMDFEGDKRRGPNHIDELSPYLARLGDLAEKTEQRVRKGEIQVVWNAAPGKQQPPGPDHEVLAWDNQLDEGRIRLVVFADGHTATLNEQEFRQLPKAK
jgi:hypothetical protein